MVNKNEGISKITDPRMGVYCLKLISGDSIIGQSKDDTKEINEKGYVNLTSVMLLKKQVITLPNGDMADMLLIFPWQEGASITAELPIPIDTVITIVEAKSSIVERYLKFLVNHIDKEMESIDNQLDNKQEVVPKPKLLQPNIAPREPQRLSSEVMMNSEMAGDFEEDEDEDEDESENLHYKIFGETIH